MSIDNSMALRLIFRTKKTIFFFCTISFPMYNNDSVIFKTLVFFVCVDAFFRVGKGARPWLLKLQGLYQHCN